MAVKGAGDKISAARTGNKYCTKKSIKAKDIIRKHSLDFGGSLEDKDVIQLAQISRNTYYRYKAEILESMRQEAYK